MYKHAYVYIYIYICSPPPPAGPTFLLQIGPNPLVLKTWGVSIYTQEVRFCCRIAVFYSVFRHLEERNTGSRLDTFN